jgi:CRP/FNR family cyclic AMP-dependent transcriptional regulator
VTKTEILNHLAGVPLFASCSKRELQAIAAAAKEVSRPAGDTLARQGEAGVGFFLITEGTAAVNVSGRKRRRLSRGDFFGEIALLDGGPRTATIVAETPVKLLGLTAWVFRGLVQQNPGMALKMLEVVASRLRSASASPTD